MVRLICCIGITLMAPFTWAQRSIEFSLDSDSLSEKYAIETLRFYVSNIQLHGSNGTHFQEENSYHLIDLEDVDSWSIHFPDAKFNVQLDSISFTIGTDSLTNVSGILEGDLDPIKGMYWAWNSGYINFKVEGTNRETKTDFEYHLGGYLPPFATARVCTLPISDLGESIKIKLHLIRFLEGIDMNERKEVMIPGPEAVELSDLLKRCFTVE